MKDFADFVQYTIKREKWIANEIVSALEGTWSEDFTLSQANVQLVMAISRNVSLAYLRQYHDWLNSND